jgi:hypothetical protein
MEGAAEKVTQDLQALDLGAEDPELIRRFDLCRSVAEECIR